MLPSIFSQIFRHGIEISRHHFKGVYVCTIGKNRNQSSKAPEVICTMHEGPDLHKETEMDSTDSAAKHGPITFSHGGLHATLRPWEPSACVIAAGIYNLLVHFPIKPGSRVFALDCSLRTLSHLADIVGHSGRLIAVTSESNPERPTEEELLQFAKMHPGVSLLQADIQNPSLESYERLLSIPQSSKYAFLMAMHPRLGERSPARRLAVDAQRLVGCIFSFLECGDAAHIKCLVVGHSAEGLQVEAIREIVLSHIDILQRWRTTESLETNMSLTDSDCRTGVAGATGANAAEQDDSADKRSSHPRKERSEKRRKKVPARELTPQWVLLDLPLDCLATPDQGDLTSNMKLNDVFGSMNKMQSGVRTGLLAKEQLPLKPYFKNHVLLLLKYVAHLDERRREQSMLGPPPGLEMSSVEALPPCAPSKPSTRQMPMPSFINLDPETISAQAMESSAAAALAPCSEPGSLKTGQSSDGLADAPPGLSRSQQGQGQRTPGSSKSHGSSGPGDNGRRGAGLAGSEPGAMKGRGQNSKGNGAPSVRFATGPDEVAWVPKHPGPIVARPPGLALPNEGSGFTGIPDMAPSPHIGGAHQQQWPSGITCFPMYNRMAFGQPSPLPQKGVGKGGHPGDSIPGQNGIGNQQRVPGGLLGVEHFTLMAEERRANGSPYEQLQYMSFTL